MKVNVLRWSVCLVSCLPVMAGLQVQGAPDEVVNRAPMLMAPTSVVPAAIESASDGTVAPVAAPEVRALPTMTIADLELADTVDVVMLLRLMAKMADVNMLISPSVKGTVGFSFRGIPWDQAFRSIVTSAGLTYVWQGDVLRVMTIEDVRSELEMETILRDRESVREDLRRVEPMVMQVISLRYLVAESVGKMITQMLSSGAEPAADAALLRRKATVSVNNEANAIIVHASRDDVEKAMQLVAQLDRPQPLVQIEAKIVEAGRDTARQLGLQWGGRSARLSDGRMITASSGSATAGGFASDFPAQFASDSTKASAGFSLGLVADRVGMNELLNLQLTALQRQGRINIQASPTVTTLDNEMALIESGEERAYRVSTGSGTVQEGTLEWKKAVLRLEVTPHVVDGRKLRVKIASNKDSFDETKPQTNNEFPVSTKSAQTTVLLADGETTMIGGFSIESSSESTTGVPFLMHVPLLGYLFKSKSTSGRFDETIIFITPTIL
jgi:type IV pilus assembly protein PilQ